jgi:hypothetical protein
MALTFEAPWFAALLAAFWFGGAAVLARLAGWAALAKAFPATSRPAGDSYRFVSASLGSKNFPIKYRNCLHLIVAQSGLYLSLMFPFKFQSPAFFVPWSGIETMLEEQLFSTRVVHVQFRGPSARLSFRGPLGQLVHAAYQHAVGENVA